MQKVKLIDIAEFIRTGKTPPTNQTQYFDGQVNWYTPGDFNNGKKLNTSKRTLTKLALEDKKAITFPKDTLLITCIGDIGKIGITQDDCSSNQQITGIKPKENTDVNYLYYWFIANKKVLENTANSAVVPILNNKTLQNIDFKFPHLPTQQKIANILDIADELRLYNKQLIEKYDALTQSLFLDMFGDPVRNEKGWKKIDFNQICDFEKTSIKPENIAEGENYIPLESIEKGTGKILNIVKVEKNELKSNKFYFTDEYILYGKLRPYLNKVALPNFSGICSTDIIPLKAKKNKTNKFFITQIMRGSGFVSYCNERCSGANLPRISPKEIEKYQIINPPIELQNQFAERIQIIESQKQQAQKALTKSELLFQGLLQQAFNGELN